MMRLRWWLGISAVLCAFLVPGCQGKTTERPASPPPSPLAPSGGDAVAEWVLSSEEFEHSGTIPATFTCEGEDISPALVWNDAPEGTKELVVICDDPDAPGGTFTHWMVWGIDPRVRSLPRSIPKTKTLPAMGTAAQGKNDFGKIGYGGPCPPAGPEHHYHFRVYALDAAIDLEPGASRTDLAEAIKGHILTQTEIVGLYGRR